MTEITTKTCSKCKVEKPTTEYRKKRENRDGMASYCKSCAKNSHARYQSENPGKCAAASAKYKKNNSQKIASRRGNYYAENPKKLIEKNAKYRNNNREKMAVASANWLSANPEKVAVRYARYGKAARESLSDSYIRRLICQYEKIPRTLIPQSLVELKRAQIQIANFLKEQAK